MATQLCEQTTDLFSQVQEKYNQHAVHSLKQELENKINSLSSISDALEQVGNYQNASLLKPEIDKIEEAKIKIDDLSEDLDDPFLLSVVGVGSYGKSTLINGLLGQRVAEMDFQPKTWKIDVFYQSEEEKVEVKYKDGSTDRVSKQEAEELLEKEEQKRRDSRDKVYKEFKKRQEEYDSLEAKEELKEILREKLLYKSNITEVRWPVESAELLEDFQLVDTPGLVQKLLGEVKMSVNEYYYKADGVLCMLSAETLASKQSREMMDKLEEDLKKVAGSEQDLDNAIAVLNKIDLLREDGGQEAVDKVYQEAQNKFGDLFKEIVPVSAKEALTGAENDDQDLIEQSGIQRLKESIRNRFFTKGQRIRINSKVQGVKRVLQELSQELLDYRQRLREDEVQRKKLARNLERELNKTKNSCQQQVVSTFESYTKRVKRNINLKAEQLFEIESEEDRKEFVEEEIFDAQSFKHKFKSLQNDISESLKSMRDYYQEKSVFKKYKHLKQGQLTINNRQGVLTTNNDSIYNQDLGDLKINFGIAFTTIGGMVFGPIGAILGGIASYFGLAKWAAKRWKLPKVKKQFRDHLEDSTAELEQKVMTNIEKQITKIDQSITEVREESFANLHGNSDDIGDIFKNISQLEELAKEEIEELTAKKIILGQY
ncbi:dynamin family protein [Halanaerobacter jeridensis]|uniref:GTPase SAR1 family protein n=1 Tax=Halanaerobacter jeridensis TaxID=706427 RepID=A0A938XXJ2_9FIRM|nr:dynamin family protein [Halanaerobacter jeridensis]MBM7558101.1 GTPase SAR1 family protein [Halanaerobacter jeridensis]